MIRRLTGHSRRSGNVGRRRPRDSAVVIKFIIKTKPLRQWAVKRELLRRIKNKFDELKIEIPFPHQTVYHRCEEGGGILVRRQD